MFSAGNVSEKLRVAQFSCEGQIVVDLYAGIGYFTLPYLVKAGGSGAMISLTATKYASCHTKRVPCVLAICGLHLRLDLCYPALLIFCSPRLPTLPVCVRESCKCGQRTFRNLFIDAAALW